MKKFPLFLAFALVLVLAVNSFSEKSGNNDLRLKPLPKPKLEEAREIGKSCYLVCEQDKRVVLYKGNERLVVFNAPIVKAVSVPSSASNECSFISDTSQVLETCGK